MEKNEQNEENDDDKKIFQNKWRSTKIVEKNVKKKKKGKVVEWIKNLNSYYYLKNK